MHADVLHSKVQARLYTAFRPAVLSLPLITSGHLPVADWMRV